MTMPHIFNAVSKFARLNSIEDNLINNCVSGLSKGFKFIFCLVNPNEA